MEEEEAGQRHKAANWQTSLDERNYAKQANLHRGRS